MLSHLPACYIATQYDAKALQESWEELVYRHVRSCSRPCQGAMGDVLPMDQHIAVGCLHCDVPQGDQRGQVRNISTLREDAERKLSEVGASQKQAT